MTAHHQALPDQYIHSVLQDNRITAVPTPNRGRGREDVNQVLLGRWTRKRSST
jgi:hypothetical protein